MALISRKFCKKDESKFLQFPRCEIQSPTTKEAAEEKSQYLLWEIVQQNITKQSRGCHLKDSWLKIESKVQNDREMRNVEEEQEIHSCWKRYINHEINS